MRSITMDMMAMAYMAHMTMKSCGWDEHFAPKPPGLLRRTFRRCIATLAARRKLS
ncbi:hypothetical protein [Ensifer adhaerens]|uniref:hypothetical protein n=1 Tax=Ensifer adhaerens TaxID=106592 RepID=UPI000B24B196|nr:hypothetical protein [Ensifer adhaerens]